MSSFSKSIHTREDFLLEFIQLNKLKERQAVRHDRKSLSISVDAKKCLVCMLSPIGMVF